ncbi:hypothetical protein DFH06DRAFT_1132618 [Mycena polygramma]|nr:hypothetical protein DFH06DRAFT_1132618 [Mycena polygramma]
MEWRKTEHGRHQQKDAVMDAPKMQGSGLVRNRGVPCWEEGVFGANRRVGGRARGKGKGKGRAEGQGRANIVFVQRGEERVRIEESTGWGIKKNQCRLRSGGEEEWARGNDALERHRDSGERKQSGNKERTPRTLHAGDASAQTHNCAKLGTRMNGKKGGKQTRTGHALSQNTALVPFQTLHLPVVLRELLMQLHHVMQSGSARRQGFVQAEVQAEAGGTADEIRALRRCAHLVARHGASRREDAIEDLQVVGPLDEEEPGGLLEEVARRKHCDAHVMPRGGVDAPIPARIPRLLPSFNGLRSKSLSRQDLRAEWDTRSKGFCTV